MQKNVIVIEMYQRKQISIVFYWGGAIHYLKLDIVRNGGSLLMWYQIYR